MFEETKPLIKLRQNPEIGLCKQLRLRHVSLKMMKELKLSDEACIYIITQRSGSGQYCYIKWFRGSLDKKKLILFILQYLSYYSIIPYVMGTQ